jgi:hypothetical protein
MNGSNTPAFTIGPSLSLDPAKVLMVVVWVVVFLWALYTLIAAYHWIRYGRQSGIAIQAIVVHVVVSIALALFAVSGFK